MRHLLLLFSICVISSCQRAYQKIDSVLAGNTQVVQAQKIIKTKKNNLIAKIEKFNSKKVHFSFDCNPIVHNHFIVLEFVDLPLDEVQLNPEITDHFTIESSVFNVYNIDSSWLQLKYVDFIGKKVMVNSQSHAQHQTKIKSVVLVHDLAQEKPYLAAVINLPDDSTTYYSWASTKSRINPFPFIVEENETLEATALIYLDSLDEFNMIKKTLSKKENLFEYKDADVKVFSGRKEEKYVLVQYNWIGNCESMAYNYSALYHVTPQHWTLEVEGNLNQFCIDLIDVDGDFLPELLLGDFSSLSIYEFYNGSFKEKNAISWSSNRCPC